MTDPNHDEDLAAFMARAAARSRGGRPPSAVRPAVQDAHDHDACHRELEQLRVDVVALRAHVERLQAASAAVPVLEVQIPPPRPGHAPSCLCAVCRADLQRALLAARRG